MCWAMSRWTEQDIPDQSGRTVLVTGANSGLGLRSAQVLAGKGARVLMACRSPQRGEAALRSVTAVAAGGGSAELVALDLADLESVQLGAQRVRELCSDRLDVLMNNAGIMMTPKLATRDGFELQLGTNHLGHAALTWLLMPALTSRPGARVVTMSSVMARPGRIDLSDPNFEHRRYRPSTAYCQAKLANLLFALELDRRATAAGLELVSAAAHPGYTATQLTTNMSRSRGTGTFARVMEATNQVGDRIFGQPVRTGALPQLYAATAPDVRGGEYYGPAGIGQLRGLPRRVAVPPSGRDTDVAGKLWELTATLTGVKPDPA